MTAAVTLVLFAALAAADDPVVLEFTSSNCPHCRTVEPVVRGLAAEGFPIRQIDATAQGKLVQQFQVRGYPTFVLVSGGREVSRIEGSTTRERLIGLLRPVASLESRLQVESSEPRKELLVRGQSPSVSRREADSAARVPHAATVRLRVSEGATDGIGTGTIIDTHFNEEAKAEEALIMTCGHIFRESQGKGKITVEIFTEGGIRSVEGTLLDFDDKRDIALVTIWPGVKVVPAQVAPKNFVVRSQDPIFTVGCSRGNEPTVEESRVSSVDRRFGKPAIVVEGSPAEGRSGGGLFSAEGLLIGICNSDMFEENQGLYASLPSVHWQLDKFNLQAIYERAAPMVVPTSATEAEPVPLNPPPARPAPAALVASQNPVSLPERPRQMPRSVPLVAESGTHSGDDMEVVFIVRSKNRPENQSEIYVVDSVSPELLSSITTAARSSAQARATIRQTQSAERLARQNRDNEQPVVRGQHK